MPLVGKSLDHIERDTNVGSMVGEPVMFDTPKSVISMQTVLFDSPSLITNVLEGTLDGENWTVLATATDAGIVTSSGKVVIGARANATFLGGELTAIIAVEK